MGRTLHTVLELTLHTEKAQLYVRSRGPAHPVAMQHHLVRDPDTTFPERTAVSGFYSSDPGQPGSYESRSRRPCVLRPGKWISA